VINLATNDALLDPDRDYRTSEMRHEWKGWHAHDGLDKADGRIAFVYLLGRRLPGRRIDSVTRALNR
jgi:hypothetical protein